MEEARKRNSKSDMILGFSMFTLGCIFYSFYCLLIKLALYKFEISVAEIVYLISCWAVPLFFISAKLNKQDVLKIPGNNQVDLFWRCLNGVLCDILMFVSYEYTTYSKGFCLFMSNTLLAPFLAYYMLNEPIKRWDIIGIGLGFTGMICLIQPWKTDANVDAHKDMIGCCFGLMAAFAAAVAFVYQKRLADALHYTVQPFHYMLTGNFFNSIWGFVSPSVKVTRYSGELYLWTVGAALLIFGE
jgi:drug/metabolite transporter (DMT)-like permease